MDIIKLLFSFVMTFELVQIRSVIGHVSNNATLAKWLAKSGFLWSIPYFTSKSILGGFMIAKVG